MIRTPRAAWFAMAAVLVGLCVAAVGPAYMNHDPAWYLHMAGVWLDGATLYRDVIDTNPPLIVFITAIPVAISRLVNLPGPLVFKAFVFAAAGLSVAVSIPFVRRIWQDEHARFLIGTMLVFLIFPFVKTDFGQREHFTVLLTVPYVLASCGYAVGRPAGRGFDAVAGALAGLGFAMKPHLLAGWVAFELALAAMRRSPRVWLRPAAVSAGVAAALYGAVVVLLVPDYLSVARDAMQVYGGLNSSAAFLLRLADLQLWVIGLLLLLVLRLPAAHRNPCVLMFAAATGFLIAAMVQLKGWGYHLYPSRVLILLFFAAVVASVTDAHPAVLQVIRGGKRSINAAVLAAVTIWSARYVAEAKKPIATDYVTSLTALIHETHADTFALLGMQGLVYPAFPTTNYSGTRWVLRHNSLWFLPGIYADEMKRPDHTDAFRRLDGMPPLERRYFEEIVEDLCRTPPKLLVLEPPIPNAPVVRRSLDLVRYYRQDPRFDRMFSAYAHKATVGLYVAYERRGEASCR
jgi:hypothetical protein